MQNRGTKNFFTNKKIETPERPLPVKNQRDGYTPPLLQPSCVKFFPSPPYKNRSLRMHLMGIWVLLSKLQHGGSRLVVFYAPYVLLFPWSWKEKSYKRGIELLFQMTVKITLFRPEILRELHLVINVAWTGKIIAFPLSSLEFVLLNRCNELFPQSGYRFQQCLFKFVNGLLC